MTAATWQSKQCLALRIDVGRGPRLLKGPYGEHPPKSASDEVATCPIEKGKIPKVGRLEKIKDAQNDI